jgi:1,4-alpha-glucan branching enzyme
MLNTMFVICSVLIMIMIIVGLPLHLQAQILQVTPPFPTADDTVTVVYDATQGTGGLRGVVPVYAHTGVITNQSRSSSDWRYVVAQWGTDNPRVRMAALGNNLHSLRFHVRSFYNVPQNEEIRQLAFVFRNANGSQEGKGTGGTDIFCPIYAPGALFAKFLSPASSSGFFQVGDTVRIRAAASLVAQLTLADDRAQLARVTARELAFEYIVPPQAAGTFVQLRLTATTTATQQGSLQSASDSVRFFVRGQTPIAPLPVGVQDGINHMSDSSVVLVLFAPNKQFVHLLGDFNDWQLTQNATMNRTPDGLRYWMRLTLPPNREYAFQYLVDGSIRIADPYAEKVLDPNNDAQIIREGRYPNLLPYPTGKTTGIVGVFRSTRQRYNWRVTDTRHRVKKGDLVIYELLVRDFDNRRTFRAVIDSLTYLKRLGINCLKLMPVMEFGGNQSWGYNPSFFFAVDKYYGTEDELRELIDSAHVLGMSVVLDVVLNHATGENPLFQLYPADSNPYFNVVARHPFNVFNDFNHEFSGTQALVDRVNRFWVEQFRVDGFRYDLSKGFTQFNSGNNVALWSARDTSRIRLLKRMADALWRVDSSSYVILEHFADNSEETELANYGMMLWGNLNYNFNEATMGWHSNPQQSDFSWLWHKRRGWNAPHLVGYMESHDEERLMFKNINFGNRSGTYSTRDTATALERMKMAATFFFSIPGAKMIWQFGELGYDYSINWPSGRDDSRLAIKPTRWDYYADPRRRALYDVYAELIRLKRTEPVFSTDSVSLALSGALKRIILWHPSNTVTIVGNFGVEPAAIVPNFPRTGVWHEFFTRQTLNVRDVNAPIMLRAGEFALYSTTPFPAPRPNLTANTLTSVAATAAPSGNLSSMEIVPNPTSSSAELRYTVEQAALVTVEVYSALGERISTVMQQMQPAGNHRVMLDGLPSSGVYVVRLRVGTGAVQSQMLIVAR